MLVHRVESKGKLEEAITMMALNQSQNQSLSQSQSLSLSQSLSQNQSQNQIHIHIRTMDQSEEGLQLIRRVRIQTQVRM